MQQYLNLLQHVVDFGDRTPNRTGVDSLSVFGKTMIFDMKDGFPLVTTKKMFYKAVIGELLWMIRGDTNIRWLLQNDIRIWTAWPYKHYMQKFGRAAPITEDDFEKRIIADDEFARTWGDCGPIYGKQWRKWKTGIKNVKMTPAEGSYNFIQMSCEYTYADQLAEAVNLLRTDPMSRRIIVNAWNVADLADMAISGLPPCHLMFQFKVRPNPNGNDFLDLLLYQRSCDLFLGVPFNITSYALLLHIISKITNKTPGRFIYVLGDAHIYVNHLDQVIEQLQRLPYPLPTLLLPNVTSLADIEMLNCDEIKILDYECHPAIKGEVAV